MFSDFQYLELMQLAFRFDCFVFFSFHFDFVSLVTGTKVLYWITALQHRLGFRDGILRPICKPPVNQHLVYSGHKCVHGNYNPL